MICSYSPSFAFRSFSSSRKVRISASRRSTRTESGSPGVTRASSAAGSSATAPPLKGKAAPKKNKYNATKSNYAGYVYDSGKEAKYAQELDLLKKAKKIKAWDRQFIIEVAPGREEALCDEGRFPASHAR